MSIDQPAAAQPPQPGPVRLSDLQLDPILAAQGWEKRFVADLRRAEETAELYREMGFEVRIEPINAADLPEGCDECRLATLLQFRTVYTHKPRP